MSIAFAPAVAFAPHPFRVRGAALRAWLGMDYAPRGALRAISKDIGT
jgi:hypothetical protein